MAIIWHNPRCSKSRQTLSLLRSRGIEPKEVFYLKNPPEISEIEDVLEMLELAPRKLMRTGEAIYKELNLADEKDDDALVKAMFHNPVLIELPNCDCGWESCYWQAA